MMLCLWSVVCDLPSFSPDSYSVQRTSVCRLTNGVQTSVGSIGANSYVPAGLSADEYRKVRAKDASKAKAKYDYNVKKAGKFLGFDEFYQKRGTDPSGTWLKAPGRGHRFAKTKYDYSGSSGDQTKGWGDAIGSIFSK